MKLNESNISKIRTQILVPSYNRQQLKTGIIHVGIGGFHRSHQAYYIHQLLEKYSATDWAICGVGLREADRNMANVLKNQDGLYTLVTQHPNGKVESEVIGSITEYLLAVDNPKLVIDKMAQPDTKIVSLTITEGGYNFNPITGDFNFENPDIQHELANPHEPKTVYGYITAALRKRRKQGLPPFTILSCDNIQHNGDMTRKMVLAFAKIQDAELAEWIEKEVGFPNSMVDRITPVTTPQIIDLVNSEYNYMDEWPVVCEPYIQWVIEDNFVNGRPALEEVGVQFVPDVTPYEKMKIRLLNAGHSVLGIPGALHGHKTINACMEDNLFASFMRQFMDKEATPILGTIEGIDLTVYKDSLEERFSNPNIKDGLNRICSESSAKLPKFLIPTIKENLVIGGSVKYGIFILVAWCYYSDKGIDIQNSQIDIIDERKEELNQRAKQYEQDQLSFLRIPDIFGSLLENERFRKHYSKMIEAIYKEPNIHKLMELINQDNYSVE
ncbi:MAG: mannitol dehydrogenase family protein [Maribacter sp.]|nr:mannitol dehydrogenase family protein [Maribacter sp.]